MRALAQHAERHRSSRSNWLRAAVLGADDGLVSTASLVLGVAASGASTVAILTAGIAGTAAGAGSMAAGEYVSVSSQRDTEEADVLLERREIAADPEQELLELADIYESRGLEPELARQVAEALTERDAVAAHVRDELGLGDDRRANPLQAAGASAAAFLAGAIWPLLAMALVPRGARAVATVVITIVALTTLGAVGARLGGAPPGRAALRVGFWGALAMGVTSGIGALVGVVA